MNIINLTHMLMNQTESNVNFNISINRQYANSQPYKKSQKNDFDSVPEETESKSGINVGECWRCFRPVTLLSCSGGSP